MANSYKVMLVIRSYRPRIRNNNDKIAFAVHATFFASGFKLVAIGRSALAKDALASSPTQGEVGIEGWNESDDEYAFVYANPNKGYKKVLVKCLAVDGKLLVDAVEEGGTEPIHLKIRVKKYATESREEGDYDAQFKNFDRLVTKLHNKILSKLDGGDGLQPVACMTLTRTSSKGKKERDPKPEYYTPRPVPLGSQFHHPSLVVERPDYSGLIPIPPVGSLPVFRDGFGGGSMLVGPHDPRILPRFGDQIQPGFMGTTPQPVVPPGARYDPIGAGLEPLLLERNVSTLGGRYDPIGTDFEPRGFGSLGRQFPRSGGDIHPDLQHFGRGFGSDFM